MNTSHGLFFLMYLHYCELSKKGVLWIICHVFSTVTSVMYNFILRIESLVFFATKQYQKSITDPFFVCLFVSLFNQEFTSCKADKPPRGMKKKRTKILKP